MLKSLPKSGGWLNSVKVVFGFLELALALKFLSIADQTQHWGILDREVFLALWIVVFFLLGLYLLGKLKFSHDSDLPYLKVPRFILAIFTFSAIIECSFSTETLSCSIVSLSLIVTVLSDKV